MLAQNFLTATELQISDAELIALIKVLGMLERDELSYIDPDHIEIIRADRAWFNMRCWNEKCECGAVHCIGGWAEFFGKVKFEAGVGEALGRLFYPSIDGCGEGWDASPEQAASALRNYLTTGEPRWKDAMRSR